MQHASSHVKRGEMVMVFSKLLDRDCWASTVIAVVLSRSSVFVTDTPAPRDGRPTVGCIFREAENQSKVWITDGV